MRTFARIEDSEVAEIISLSVDPNVLYHPSLVWVDITSLEKKPEQGYSYTGGKFVAPVFTTADPVHIAASMQAGLIEEATKAIVPLQDATDIGMATEKETALLTEWKKYRMRLSRIDTEKATKIAWPVKPE